MSIYRRKLMMAYAANLGRGDIVYPGLIAAWSAKGKSNDDEDRAILKDLTGNGHDITLNGFAFAEMSGYGGYNENWLSFVLYDNPTVEKSSNKIVLYYPSTETRRVDVYKNQIFNKTERFEIPEYIVKVSGLNDDDKITVTQWIGQDFAEERVFTIGNGENIIPAQIASVTEDNFNHNVMRYTTSSIKLTDKRITMEILPEYPDALVFDGVDDWGVNNNMPIQDDFTLIIKADVIQKSGLNAIINKDKGIINAAFNLRWNEVYVYGSRASIAYADGIVFLTPTNYNGNIIEKGTGNDVNVLNIGCIRTGTHFCNMAFYSAYLFDRSLDEQEIKAFIRKYIDPEYLLPSEIPTPDCYYDFSSGSNDDENRETIKDYSGNGNNAVAHNFAWNTEGSGYKDSALYFDGIDDYVSLDAFDSGFKTVFMLFNPLWIYATAYDGTLAKNIMGISTGYGTIAYTLMNNGGITYINGIINTKLKTQNFINKKHLVVNKNESDDAVYPSEEYHPVIGAAKLGWGNNKMVLYKFLGFKEALTEEQIQYVIKKYNLLDGVDEIEVS